MKTLFMLGLFFSFPCFLGIAINSTNAAEKAKIEPFALTTEAIMNPVGIDEMVPRLSWKSKAVDSNACNLVQTAYEILVASTPENLANDNGDLWDSGKMKSDCSIFIDYQRKQLQTSQHCYWKVRVWDGNDNPSNWSDCATWVMGVLRPEDWKAKWIAQPEEYRADIDLAKANWILAQEDFAEASNQLIASEKSSAENQTRYFRREFEINQPEKLFNEKNLFGVFRYAANKRFEIFINGQKVGHSIGMIFNADQLRTIDISENLVSGKNVVAVKVSNDNAQPTALLGQIEVKLIDKVQNNVQTYQGIPGQTILNVPTDESWFVSTTEVENWNQKDCSDAHWAQAAKIFDADGGPWGKVRRHSEKVSPMFQKNFSVKGEKKVKSSTLHITGLGFYEAYLDGQKIGSKKLDPAPTQFDKTVLYSTYDLTDFFKNSENNDHNIEVMLGHGWFDVRSIVTWNFDAAPWRSFPQMIAQLEIEYDDGSTEMIISDNSWTFSTSPILFDCIRQGEIVQGDFQRKILGQAVCVNGPKGRLKAQNFPGTILSEEFQPKSIRETSPGVWLVDLGQNIAGWARIKIHNAAKGDVIRFRYSERILEDGSIERFDIAQHFMEGSPSYYVGQKGQFQTDFYLCQGGETETFEPRFTYNGFQYIEITGLKTPPNIDDFVACVIHNDFNQIGSFECSNELLNKIQNATLWSYRANYVNGYPTDCPHREKNGWTGDAHLATEQAMFNWENSAAYEKWIADLMDEQQPNGDLAAIVPTGGWGYPWGNGPAWDSSLILIPWYLYQYRGDIRILEKSFESMKKYVDFMTTKADKNLVSHGLGDWVFYKTETPVVVTSSAFYYIDALIVAKIAQILGKMDDFQKYYDLASKIQNSYNEALYQGKGIYSIAGQTAQSTPLHQGLADSLSEAERQQIFAKLVESVEKANYHFDVGIFGAKYILRTLSENGRTDLAMRLVLQESQPSYADWIRRGAGTLWEDWGNGSSRNHIMFGDISAWFYQSLAGIKLLSTPEQAASFERRDSLENLENIVNETFKKSDTKSYQAFKRFKIAPKCQLSDINVPEGQLTWVAAQVDSPFGLISSNWEWNDEKTELTLKCSIPVNTNAIVILPCNNDQQIQCDQEVHLDRSTNQGIISVGSGNYEFKVVPKK